jgi:hypothetical protein
MNEGGPKQNDNKRRGQRGKEISRPDSSSHIWREQEVLGRTARLLSFHMTCTKNIVAFYCSMCIRFRRNVLLGRGLEKPSCCVATEILLSNDRRGYTYRHTESKVIT